MADNIESSSYFHKVISLVIDVGTETLRDKFYSIVPKHDVRTYFSQQNIKSEFDKLKSKKRLTNIQYEKLTVNPDPDSYDISLLITLLTNHLVCGIRVRWARIPPESSDITVGADLLRLRDVRNKIIAHRTNAQLSEADFQRLWSDIETILLRIALSVDMAEETKIKGKVHDAKNRVLEPLHDREKKLLQIFVQWHKEDAEKCQEQLTEMQNSLEQLHLKVDSIPRPTDETDASRSDDTLTSLQSQVSSFVESVGSIATQDCVNQIQEKLKCIADMVQNSCKTQQMLQPQFDDFKLCLQTISQQIQSMGNQQTSLQFRENAPPRPIVQPTDAKPKTNVTNPNAMSEKFISDISSQIANEWEGLRIHLDFTEAQSHALAKAHDNSIQHRIHVMLKAWHDVVVECGENPRMLLAAAFVNSSTNYSMAYKLVPKDQFKKSASAKPATIERIQSIVFCKDHHYVAQGDSMDQGDGMHLLYNRTGMQPPYGGTSMQPPYCSTSMQPPYGGTSMQPPYSSTSMQQPYGGTSMEPPYSSTSMHHGGTNSFNVYGGEVTIEGSVAIHSASTSQSHSMSDASSVSGDGRIGGQHGSINIYDGKVMLGAGSNVVIGPPGLTYPTQAHNPPTVRGEGPVVPDMASMSDNPADAGRSMHSSCGSSGQPFKKETDDTLCQSMVAALHGQMESVGVLIHYGSPLGTVFRVGSRYVMTALHVIKDIIDPKKDNNIDTTALESVNTYITFNESPISPSVKQFRLKSCFEADLELDVVVLEILNPSNLPMKMNLRTSDIDAIGITDVSLVGYGHPGQPKKCLDPKCQILHQSSQRIRSAQAFIADKYGYYRSALQQVKKNPAIVDKGYLGYDSPNKMLIDCFMEAGASGAPALTNYNERSIEVVGMLTLGIPEFYFSLPKLVQSNFPDNYRFESCTKMKSIYEWFSKACPDLTTDLFTSA